MLNVSAKWQRAVMLDNDINVNCFADIVTAGGEKIPISDSELWANGFEVNDSTSSNGTFTIGALIAGKLKIKLNNIYEDYSKYDFDKASVTAYVSKSFSDGTTEKLKIGEYRVSETSYDGSLITLTCLDNINNFNREYDSNLSYPTTAYEVVRDACIKCDVPFTMARFDNSDYVINEIPSDNQKLTYGQVIAYILQLSGLWGKCGHDGELLIGWYDMSQFDSKGYDGGTFSTKTTPYSDGDALNGGNFTDYSSGDTADGGTFTEARNYHNIYTQKDLNVATDDVVITGVSGVQYVKDAKGKTLVTLDNKGLTLDSSVKIAWDNVADTTAKVTQITKDTVTTSYVNALDVKAGSVDAEDITGTTITGKNIVGGTIDIGNGVFTVDSDGKVTASNFNMSGGSIALDGNLSNSTIDLTATDNSGNNYELWMNGAVLRIVKNDENLITLYGATGSIGAQTMYAQEIGSDKFRETDRGYAMCGDATGHTYHCGWNGSALSFQVDATWVWSSSDKRLKKNIKAINQDYIDAVGSVDLFQYNLNRQGYSDKPLYFGAMAQDIIEKR